MDPLRPQAVTIGLLRLLAAARTIFYPECWRLPAAMLPPLRRGLRLVRPTLSNVGIVLHPYAPPIGGAGYRRYLAGLRRLHAGARVPLTVHLAITDRCPYACVRCSNIPTGVEEPSTEALEKIIGICADAGTASIAFTGGEPLWRADLPRLVATATRAGLSTILFTSGHGLDDATAGSLRAAGLELAFVSLDHHQAEPHDAIRGGGAHARAVAALGAARRARLHVVAQGVASPELLDDASLRAYLLFCRECGAHEAMLIEPAPVRGGETTIVLTEKQRARLDAIHRRSAAGAPPLKVSTQAFLEGPDFLGCQAGYSFLHINTAGTAYPCDFLPRALGEVTSDGMTAILQRAAMIAPRPVCFCPVTCEAADDRIPAMMPWLR